MKLTRRQFVVSTSSALALIPACGSGEPSEQADGGALEDVDGAIVTADANGPDAAVAPDGPGPEPDPWTAPGTEDGDAFAWGLQVGDATPSTVFVSVRTTLSSVTLKLMRGTESGWIEEQSLDSLAPDDKVVQVAVDALYPDQTYSIAFFSDDEALRSPVARFRTAPSPGASRLIRFGATSCLGGNRPWPSMQHLAGEKLDFFCLLGDTSYADWNNPDGTVYNRDHYEAKWESALAVDGLTELAASTSLIATWDDHEVQNNWAPGSANAITARTAFGRALPIDEKNSDSIWRSLRWGDSVEVFVLDIRSERENGNYISVEQMNWLKDALTDSPCHFKIIMNSVPVTKLSIIPIGLADRWEGYPAQRSEILNHITDNSIGGVVWITGDYHFGAVSKIDPSGPASELWEVMCGPGGSPINAAAPFLFSTPQVPIIVKTHNSVLFEADPDAGTLRFQFMGLDQKPT